MYEFLRQHPDIFLPEKKELLLFATDLSYPTRLSTDEFLTHFVDHRGEKRVGTAHTAYLQSTTAAGEIKAAQPAADIIIMIRNPIDVLPSWHSELLYETIEDIDDFGAALDAESARRSGSRIPRAARNSYIESLYYTNMVAFSEQIERYRATFGDSHLHIIVHDDLRDDPYGTYRESLRFLGVDTTYSPRLSTVNPNKEVRSRALQNLYFRTASPVHAIKRLVPRPLRQRLLSLNAREIPRPDLPPDVRRRLERELRDEITRLSILLHRDLSSWITSGG